MDLRTRAPTEIRTAQGRGRHREPSRPETDTCGAGSAQHTTGGRLGQDPQTLLCLRSGDGPQTTEPFGQGARRIPALTYAQLTGVDPRADHTAGHARRRDRGVTLAGQLQRSGQHHWCVLALRALGVGGEAHRADGSRRHAVISTTSEVQASPAEPSRRIWPPHDPPTGEWLRAIRPSLPATVATAKPTSAERRRQRAGARNDGRPASSRSRSPVGRRPVSMVM